LRGLERILPLLWRKGILVPMFTAPSIPSVQVEASSLALSLAGIGTGLVGLVVRFRGPIAEQA
jgi:hypothetical protein